MTAAYNEELNIGRTIESVLEQTLLPARWVIVSDGSIDRTDEIVEKFAKEHSFITFFRITRPQGRSFGSKVAALRVAQKHFDGIDYGFVGNLDADVSIAPNYYESLIRNLQNIPTLGIAGGYVCEEKKGRFENRRSNRVYSVAHAGQLVRRECYEAIQGYTVLQYGGEDWHAQISSKMKGWDSQSFPDLKVFHHRHTGQAENLLRHKFRQGRMDYGFGSYATFEFVKCIERFPEKPLIVGSLSRMCGFLWSWISREKRPVSSEFVAFLRNEQKQKLRSLVPGLSKHAEPVRNR